MISPNTAEVRDSDSFGNLVQFHRKKRGLTQAQLAQLAGIGKTAVFDIENATKQPRLSTILAVLNVLNIKMLFDSPLMAAYLAGSSDAQG